MQINPLIYNSYFNIHMLFRAVFEGVRLIGGVPLKARRVFFDRNMSMKALIVEEFGDSSKLQYADVAKPVPAEGEVHKLLHVVLHKQYKLKT